jgi:hypothetical protein
LGCPLVVNCGDDAPGKPVRKAALTREQTEQQAHSRRLLAYSDARAKLEEFIYIAELFHAENDIAGDVERVLRAWREGRSALERDGRKGSHYRAPWPDWFR